MKELYKQLKQANKAIKEHTEHLENMSKWDNIDEYDRNLMAQERKDLAKAVELKRDTLIKIKDFADKEISKICLTDAHAA